MVRQVTLEELRDDGENVFDAVEKVFQGIWSKYDEILAIRRLSELITPYMAEIGLSVALEPSSMLFYVNDNVPFIMDMEADREEPSKPGLDHHCLDRY